MLHRVWRHFGPRTLKPAVASADLTTVSSIDTMDIYERAENQIYSRLSPHPRVDRIKDRIVELRHIAERTNSPSDWLAALIIQAPQAALAQVEMDKHRRGYRNKKSRLFELIDFNDVLVYTVLALGKAERREFADLAKQACDRLSKAANSVCFTDKQWEAIVRGLSREIAIYLAAQESGFDAVMTSRTQDALGIDMQIRDPNSRRYINIDVKTPSAFRYRLEELVEEGRLSPHGLIIADQVGYATITNGHDGDRTEIVLLCILPERLGEIEHFEFINTATVRDMLNRLIQEHGLSDGKFDSKSVVSRSV